ncbi:MAG: nucleotidyltransferase family protein [Adhaeribacter sp.]
MFPDSSNKIGVVILAAGGSSRLGQAKQLLPYKGESLIRHAVHAAIDAACKPIIVVTGASAKEVIEEIKDCPVELTDNPLWEEGMASSIKAGVQQAKTLAPDLDGLILMVCDQPYVNAHLLRKLKKTWQSTGKGLAACTYAGTAGTPAIISKDYFDDLLNLQGQQGAKKILLAYKDFLALVPFPMGQVDIDTPDDLKKLEE